MKFEFLRLKAKNFVLYEDLDLKFRELEGNLIFIVGNNLDISGTDSNCSGKSLIGDLFADLLFDKTIRRHSQKSFIGEFGKWCVSSLLIQDTISKEKYLIKKFRNHPKYGDKLFFTKKTKTGKVSLSRKTKADTYREIWRVLGINWKTFKNRNYFGQDDSERFLRVTDTKKAEIIIDIQDLSDFQRAKDLSNDNLKKLKEDFQESDSKMIAVDKQLELLREMEEKIFKKKKECISTKDLALKISKIEKNILKRKASKEREEKLLQEMNEKKLSFSKKKNKLANEIEKKDRLMAKILEAEKEIGDLKNKVTVRCSKCGASLDREKRLKSIRGVKRELEEGKKKLIFFTEKIHKLRTKIEVEEPLLKKAVCKIKTFSSKPGIDFEEKLRSLKGEESKFEILTEELKDIKEKIEELLGEKSLLEKKLRILQLKRRKNEFSKAVFGKTIRNLFDDFLNNLNRYSNVYLDDLCDNDISVIFDSKVERKSKKIVDEISVLVSVDGSSPRDFRTYSGGEKSRVELVTQLVLFSSADSNFPFLFLDEPLTGLDKTGRERVINLLQKISEEGNKVFVISNKNIPTGYGEILEVNRYNGRSTIKNA